MNSSIVGTVFLSATLMIAACAGSAPSHSSNDNSAGAKAGARMGQDGIRRTVLEIEEQSRGSCAHVSAIDTSARRPVVDSCHGWSVAGCTGILFAHGRGVRVDSGAIVARDVGAGASAPSRQMDPGELVQTAIEQERGRAFEYLHLRFGEARCTGSGMEIGFSGSTIRRGAQGSADAMRGTIVVEQTGRASARLLPGAAE